MERQTLINPITPPGFYWQPLNERSPEQLQHWTGRPFIVTAKLDDQDQTDPAFCADWLTHYPTGTRYSVLCLEPDSLNGPNLWGHFASIEQAQQHINERQSRTAPPKERAAPGTSYTTNPPGAA